MKFKKLLISASAIAAGSGLLATVLTSCAKASVDEKLKIELNDQGLLFNPANMGDAYKLDYKGAIRLALTRSSNWTQFKNALAEEIVFKWFENRMATKGTEDKNTNFRTSYDEWEYQINKDYNDTVQNCKNKYGANWQFYLQNEYLAPLGGTEASYKHAKMAEKIKADFISKVFAKNYFGMLTTENPVYPHIYSAATKNIDRNVLRNPANWDKFGFYARAELGFNPGTIPSAKTDVKPEELAKNPDGDYATIQEFVFDRWFDTEKPFFASAALFKYSNPKTTSGGKLEGIYDAQRTGVKLPTDKPNEAFPFFGSGTDSGTDKAVRFFKFLNDGNFSTNYYEGTTEVKTNGTVTIPLKASDDGQTCLLVSGNKMFSELYTPYAIACGNLYAQMFGGKVKSPNTLDQDEVEAKIVNNYTGTKDDFGILSCFFYNKTDYEAVKASKITKAFDLLSIYPSDSKTYYHCPLFLENKAYPYFYGNEYSSVEKERDGIQFITNNIQVDLKSDAEITTGTPVTAIQPWVMELNEAGMHVLTIDGYCRVADEKVTDKKAELKKLVKYRLMQKQCNDEAAANIHADLLEGKNNLKTYFNDNFTNIILEIAMSTDDTNVFRTVESYKEETTGELFLNKIWQEQALGSTYDNLVKYLTAVNLYEENKKCLSTLESANSKIYSYHSKQIANAKAKEQYSKTIFENGLFAPFVYAPQASTQKVGTEETLNNCMYDYNTVNRVIVQDRTGIVDGEDKIVGWTTIQSNIVTVEASAFITDILNEATINGSTAFSPQYTAAKNSSSNRIWYKSSLVDKFMYSFMGNKANTANGIKMCAYNYYMSKHNGSAWYDKLHNAASSTNAFATSYARSKVLTGDKNLATYVESADSIKGASDFYTLMKDSFYDAQNKALIENGQSADDIANFLLWEATLLYLTGSDKAESEAKDFDNFYTILNTKIGEDETAIVGYLTKGDTVDHKLLNKPIGKITKEPVEETPGSDAANYIFNPNVDNIFDKDGYSGRSGKESTGVSNASQWSVVQKTYGTGTDAFTKDFSGFLGLQTKASNQLDSASGLQAAVFDSFARSIYQSTDITTGNKYEWNRGCWFQFAGSKDAKGQALKIAKLTAKVGSETIEFDPDVWFPMEGAGSEYAPVRKLAKKIREYGSMDDLRALAQTLNKAYDGRSEFAGIADGTTTFEDTDQMRMAMLKLLPSVVSESEAHKESWKPHDLTCFLRASNVEAHTTDTTHSYVFEDYSGKNSYKLLMTQINKADALERTITPTWDDGKKEWKMDDASPLSAQEFWIILFNMASESTVQQRAITEIVKTAFGDNKLVVYDAQLYNQFDSVWIKDWTKKTMGA